MSGCIETELSGDFLDAQPAFFEEAASRQDFLAANPHVGAQTHLGPKEPRQVLSAYIERPSRFHYIDALAEAIERTLYDPDATARRVEAARHCAEDYDLEHGIL